uniref:PDZ domain-containing protein n=1 Tax=Aureoumbra lagunensis TaxID=44058 RepID=A0A7S3JY79_9STRA|mmetsp:Transcript_9226/g.12775  ORF Transcript_9226/g.12775 Transcript_9226/m.12775 type:complete len:678 (+) Transcript_9226:50-2083(+)
MVADEEKSVSNGEEDDRGQAEANTATQTGLAKSSAMTLLPQNFRSATIPRQPNGSLGMVVREREDGDCYVEGFADDAAELTARGSVIPGDHILAVAGKFIDGKGQRHLRELLKDAPDPVVLLLRRDSSGESMRSGGGGGVSNGGSARPRDGPARDDGSEAASADSYGSAPNNSLNIIIPRAPPRLPRSSRGMSGTTQQNMDDPNEQKMIRGQALPSVDVRLPPGFDTDIIQKIRRAAEATAPPPDTIGIAKKRKIGPPMYPPLPPPTTGTYPTHPPWSSRSSRPIIPSEIEKDSSYSVRFGLGPLSVVLERARSDVDALITAYKANVFTRWQLKTALRERAPTLDGRPSKLLRQGASHRFVSDHSAAMYNVDKVIDIKKLSAQDRSTYNFPSLGTPDERQRILMLMLAHNISPEYIDAHVLNKDKDTHLRRDKLVTSRGYYIAISQERMQKLYEANDSKAAYIYFTAQELAPLPRLFTDCGFVRSRATMSIDRVCHGQNQQHTFRAQLQRVRFTFSSANHPDEAPLSVDFDLTHTKPFYDLLGIQPGVGVLAIAQHEAALRAGTGRRASVESAASLSGKSKRPDNSGPTTTTVTKRSRIDQPLDQAQETSKTTAKSSTFPEDESATDKTDASIPDVQQASTQHEQEKEIAAPAPSQCEEQQPPSSSLSVPEDQPFIN